MIEQYDTLAEKFLRKGFWLYFFSLIIGPMGYITRIVISHNLEVSEVGIIYGIISLLGLLIVFNDIGMAESLKHFIPKYVTENRYDKVKFIILFSFFVQLITSVIVGLFFFFGAPFIATNYFHTETASEVLRVFSFYFVFLCISQTLENFFIAIQDTFAHKIVELLRAGLTMLYVIFVFFLGYGNILNFSYGWILGLFIATFISLIIFFKKYYKKYLQNEKTLIEKSLLKEITKYAFFVFLGASVSTILSQIDMQMIIYILGTEDAGYYTNYLSIINIPFLVIGPVLGFLFPVFSELYSKGNTEKIKFVKHFFTKLFLLIGIMFNIFFFIFAPILAYTIFGEKFIESGYILKYSILLLIFNYLLQINFNLMAGVGRVKERVNIILVAIVFNFIANLVLIKFMGVEGAALATGLGWVLIWIMSEKKLRKKYFSSFEWKPLILNFIVFVTMGIIWHYFIIWDYSYFNRIESFFMLGLCFFVRCLIFLGINWKESKGFLEEMKRIRR